jgi:peptidoglycan hydrolase-like protein with peptidoglycan-binding domain
MNKKILSNIAAILVLFFVIGTSFYSLNNKKVEAVTYTQTYTEQADFSNWTLTNVDKDSIPGSLVLNQSTGGNLGSYSTTDTSKKDAAHTNAVWNSNGALSATDTSSIDLRSKLVGVWGQYPGANINALAVGGGKVYIGGMSALSTQGNATKPSFGYYSVSGDSYTDLSSVISWINDGSRSISAMVWDVTNNVLHIGSSDGDWGIYNPSTNTFTALSFSSGGASVNSIVYDSSDHKIYAATGTAGSAGSFWVYDPSLGSVVALTQTSGLQSFWTGNIYSLAYDASNNLILIGGEAGQFAKYYPTDNSTVNLTSDLNWGSNGVINSMAFDGAGLLYMGGNTWGGVDGITNGQIARFDVAATSTAVIQSGMWNNTILSVQYNSAENTMYFGGVATYNGDGTTGSYFSKYVISSATYSTISNSWKGDIKSLIFDSSSSKLYLGAQATLNSTYTRPWSIRDYHWFGEYSSSTFTDRSLKATLYSGSSFKTFSVAVDPANANVYLLAYPSGYLAKYNIASNSMSLISLSNSNFTKLEFDTINNVLYLSGGSSNFGKYNPSNGVFTDLSTNLNWGLNDINQIVFNSQNAYILLLSDGNSALQEDQITWPRGVLYNTATGAFTTLTLPWADARGSFTYAVADSVGGDFYIARGSADSTLFDKYNPSSNSFTELISNLPTSFMPTAMVYNNYDRSIYLSGYLSGINGHFVKYSISSNTSTEFTSALSSFWGTTGVTSLVADSLGDFIYIVGYQSANGKFAEYDPEDNSASNLSGVISSWGAGVDWPQSIAFDSSHDNIYIGGTSGHFQKYIISSSQVQTTALSSSDVKEVILSTAPSTSVGKVKYYVSNDGGSTFTELTSSAPVAFASSGNDLRIKTVLVGGASISPPTINFSTASVASGVAKFIFSSLSKRIWQSFVMDSSTPAGSSIVVSYRTADTQDGLSLQNFVETSGPLAGTSKYIEFSIQLIASGGVSPIINDLQLVYQAEAMSEAGANPNISTTPTPSASPSPSASVTAASPTPSVSASIIPTLTPVPTISSNPNQGRSAILINLPTITDNSLGKYVSIVQSALKERGYLATITKDGIFDDNTKNAVATLQKDNGINPLKIIGPRSKAVLNNQPIYANLKRVSSTEGAELLKYKFSKDLKFGNSNAEVSNLQKILYIRSFFFGPFSGYFGPLTQSAVKEFQNAYNLTPSGELDKNTQDKLNSL